MQWFHIRISLTKQLVSALGFLSWTIFVTNPDGKTSNTVSFTVNSSAAPVLTVTPTSVGPVGTGAGSTSFSVSNTGGGTMSYSAVSNATSWLTISSGASGGNSGTISVNYTANTGAQRSGTLTVTAVSGVTGSPATVTVIQAASGGDTTPPTLSSTTPVDNATGVAVGTNIILTFNEAVMAGSGHIEIHKSSDGSLDRSIAVTDTSQVTFSGSSVTVNPNNDLAANTNYYLILASGVIKDLAGNNYAGISSATVFNFTTSQASAGGFLASPLSYGVYSAGIMNSILDHSMVVNPNGRYPYKDPNSNLGLNGKIEGFDGEIASGAPKRTDVTCIRGTISLKPTPTSAAMTNTSGCGTGYASYDEHPGYDYSATFGNEVKAAAAGYVVNYGGQLCVLDGIATCSAWGFVGIDHQNGYVSQYGHLSTIYVTAGQWVTQGQVIGLSGDTGVKGHPHLHFEVLKLIPGHTNDYNISNYAVVDPYGWTGSTSASDDPIYSNVVYGILPAKLWQ